MSELADSKSLYQATCATNSEPYALQTIGDMMSPEFSENCIIIIDPSMPIHHKAYVIIELNDELYFRQYFEENGRKLLRCLNSSYAEIELFRDFEVRGCIIQHKQRKLKPIHNYLPNEFTGEIEFNMAGTKKKNNYRFISSK